MNKKLLLIITVLSVIPSIKAFFDFDAFDAHFEQMEQQARSMRKRMNRNMRAVRGPAQSGVTASLKEDDESVTVTFSGISPELEASLNDNNDRLSISTPEHKIAIIVRGNQIGIEASQEQKETRKKEGEDDDTFTAQYIGSSYSRMSQTVGAKLLLDKQTIDYDEENSELIVRIPKEAAKKGTPVTINKITKEKAAEETEEQKEKSE